MKKTYFLFVLCLWLCLPLSTRAAQETATQSELLLKLFPGSSLQVVDRWFGKQGTAQVLSPISLRNRHGLISITDAKIQPVGDRYLALSFEIFLTSEREVLRLVQEPLVRNPPGALKLLQLVLFDAKTGSVIGKPNGFPLEADGWTCTGDFCSTVNLIGFLSSPPDETFAILHYGSGVDWRSIIAVAVDTVQKPIAGPSVRIGELGGESGCHIEVSFSSFSMNDGEVYGVRDSDCDASCKDLCKRQGLPPGKSQTRVPLLREGAHP